jgi:hypothetical protein
MQHVVVLVVEVQCYEPEGHGLNSQLQMLYGLSLVNQVILGKGLGK